MSYDQGIASRLRAAGLRVSEVSGWQTRGSSSFSPRGAVNHHTAGGAKGATPSLNTVIYGRPDLAGPLCHVLQSREADGRDIAYVVAAGRANHAGSGNWRGLSGNSSVYGLEIEHTGVSPLPEARQRIAARIHAAMLRGISHPDPNQLCQHFEWTSRKIDAAQGVNPNTFRSWVADLLAGGPQEDDMTPDQANQLAAIHNAVMNLRPESSGQHTIFLRAKGADDKAKIIHDAVINLRPTDSGAYYTFARAKGADEKADQILEALGDIAAKLDHLDQRAGP